MPTLLIAAVLLGVVNAIVKPIAFILTLPITVLTLGLFLFVLNAAMVALVAWMLPGFHLDSFKAALLTAIIVWIVSWIGSLVHRQAHQVSSEPRCRAARLQSSARSVRRYSRYTTIANAAPQAGFQRTDLERRRATRETSPPERYREFKQRTDGLLINGSVNNGVREASPFGSLQAAAFGNFRRGPRSLYTGGIGWIVDHSALDARPFSLTGQGHAETGVQPRDGRGLFGRAPQIRTSCRATGRLFRELPVAPQSQRHHAAGPDAGRAAARGRLHGAGDRSPDRRAFPGNVIPQSRISPQATALLGLVSGRRTSSREAGRHQVPLVAITHQAQRQSRWNKTAGHTNQLGSFAFQSVHSQSQHLRVR